jgi:hypothetical protein
VWPAADVSGKLETSFAHWNRVVLSLSEAPWKRREKKNQRPTASTHIARNSPSSNSSFGYGGKDARTAKNGFTTKSNVSESAKVVLALIAVAVALTAVAAVPAFRESLFAALGWALVVDEPVGPADIIVVSLDSGGAGALEAADLVKAGIAKQVAVFTDPPSGEDWEFIRRGLPYENESARQIRQLKSLGVADILQISRLDPGTRGEAQVLPTWCDQNGFRAVVFVAARDHSRRTQRLLDRVMRNHATHVTIRPSHYSSFEPERWWETRSGIRIEIIELQKLMFDIALHPI